MLLDPAKMHLLASSSRLQARKGVVQLLLLVQKHYLHV